MGKQALHTKSEFGVEFVDLGCKKSLRCNDKWITGACKQRNVNKKRDDANYINFCKLICNMIVLTE